MHTHTISRLISLLAVCFTLLLSACGGSSGNGGTGTTGTTGGDGDCRNVGNECTAGFMCGQSGDGWECLPDTSNGTSNGTGETSNGTTGTSNGTTGTSNGTTGTSNGTTGTSNGTTGMTSNGTTGGDLCDGVTCDDGQTCDPDTGTCVGGGDPCDDVNCPDGQTCEDGACVEVDPCDGINCPDDQVCDGGECVTFECVNDDDNTNDEADRATALSGDDQTLDGLSICEGDQDWFVLELTDGQDAIIDLLFNNNFGDLDLFLYDEDGRTELQRSRTNTDDEHLYIAAVSGRSTLYISVVGGGGVDEAEYILDVDIDPEGDVCFIDGDCGASASCVENFCEEDPPCINDDDCGRGELCDAGVCVLFECFPDGDEENDTEGSATMLPAQSQTLDELTLCADDEDWYSFPLGAGQDAIITMNIGGGEGDLDLRVYLGSADSPIGDSTGEGDSETVGVPAVEEATTVFVLVYGFPRGDVPGENSYTLDIEIDPAGFACNTPSQCGSGVCDNDTRLCEVDCLEDNDCDLGEFCNDVGGCTAIICDRDEAEPNNIQDEAVVISEGLTDGLALCDDESDWFRFTINQDATLVYLTVSFTHREGDIEADIINGNNGFESFGRSSTDNEYLVAELDAGVYWVELYHDIASRDVSNAYTLNLEFNPDRNICLADSDCGATQECGPQFECVGFACFSNRDCPTAAPICSLETERCTDCTQDVFDLAGRNDNEDDATNINDNLAPNDLLNTCDGEDFYRFNASAGQLITVSLDFDHDDGDLDITLIFPDGNTETEFSGNDNELLSTEATQSGTYILRVFSLSSPDNPNYNEYRLNVSITDP